MGDQRSVEGVLASQGLVNPPLRKSLRTAHQQAAGGKHDIGDRQRTGLGIGLTIIRQELPSPRIWQIPPNFHGSHKRSQLFCLSTLTRHILRRSPSRHYERCRHLNPAHLHTTPASIPARTSVKMSTAELATSYAALILADDGVEITVCLAHRAHVPLVYSC